MEYEIKKESTSMNDFDFMSKRESQATIKPKINFQKFLNISKTTMITAGISLAVGITSLSGYEVYKSNIDSKISAAETVVKASSGEKIMNFIGKEKSANEKTYINNQLLINQYGQYKDVIEVLNKQQEVANYQSKNTQLYNTISKALNTDILSIDTLYKSPTQTRDEKISAYLETPNVAVAKKWENAITTNEFVHIGNMMDLNHEIKNSLANIDQVKQEIVAQVQTRIKNGDFDLSAAQNQFSKDVTNQTQAQLNDLNQAKKDLADLKNQSVTNDDGSVTQADPNAQNIISDKDLNDASSALNEYQSAAVNQIGSDRTKVEQLIAEAKQQEQQTAQNNVPVNNGIQNSNMNQNPNVVVVNNNRGPSFLDYYLMYSWMNSSPSTTVIHQTTVNYPNNNSYQTNQANRYSNTANYKPINIPKANMYDINNSNSYLNKQLERKSTFNTNINGNANTFGKSSDAFKKVQQFEKSKINIAEIRSKIADTKMKVQQAKTVRATEISKIQTAKTNKYEAAVAKSTYKSTSSKSSFGSSRSSSFGGSR